MGEFYAHFCNPDGPLPARFRDEGALANQNTVAEK